MFYCFISGETTLPLTFIERLPANKIPASRSSLIYLSFLVSLRQTSPSPSCCRLLRIGALDFSPVSQFANMIQGPQPTTHCYLSCLLKNVRYINPRLKLQYSIISRCIKSFFCCWCQKVLRVLPRGGSRNRSNILPGH